MPLLELIVAGMSVASRREQPQAATYSKRLKDSIKSILDNYGEILKASKVRLRSNPGLETDLA